MPFPGRAKPMDRKGGALKDEDGDTLLFRKG